MIEIQLTISGEWIPLVRAATSMDLGIAEAQRILNSGLTGVRIRFPRRDINHHHINNEWGGIAFEAYRYMEPGTPGERFAWRSATMAAPAFADL